MEIIVGNVCFIKDPKQKKVLLLKRNKKPFKDKYTGVGGKTLFTEDILDSCKREVKEETGLDVNPKLKGVVKTINGDSSWILFIFTANKAECKLSFCDEGEINWFSYSGAKKLDLIAVIKALFPKILDEKTFIQATIKHDEEKIYFKKIH